MSGINRTLRKQRLAREALTKYSEDEPRDDHGRWTTGDGPRTDGNLKQLAQHARDAGSFVAFRQGYLFNILHGRYYHVTSDPNFIIDPAKGARDMSSMGGGNFMANSLMVTGDLNYWLAEYEGERNYVATIDLTGVPYASLKQASRGFGNEMYIKDASQARVERVQTIKQAKASDARFQKLLPQSEEELRAFYDAAISVKKQHRRISKVTSADLRRLSVLLKDQEAIVRDAILLFVRDMRSNRVLQQVTDLLSKGDVAGVLAVASGYAARVGDALSHVFMAGGQFTAASIARQLGPSNAFAISFDATNASAALLMRQNRLLFIRQFTDQQRAATGAALTAALQNGSSPRQAARVFRDSIGLTDTQLAAVDSYRASLVTGSTDALDRALRDQRFDPTVEQAVAGDVPLTGSQIDRMVGAYQDNMVAMRADTIARTETMRALNASRQEAITQAVDQANMDASTVIRTWVATQDNRTRDTHAEMDGQEVGLNEPFESPSGALLMYPGDPDAPPEETINCRCVVSVSFDGGGGGDTADGGDVVDATDEGDATA